MTKTRQVAETIHGLNAQEYAEQLKARLIRSDEGVHTIAAPWDNWYVRECDGGGWGVFVEEQV